MVIRRLAPTKPDGKVIEDTLVSMDHVQAADCRINKVKGCEYLERIACVLIRKQR
jgi:hypothetical protein